MELLFSFCAEQRAGDRESDHHELHIVGRLRKVGLILASFNWDGIFCLAV